MTFRADGGDEALQSIVDRNAKNVGTKCRREAELFVANLLRALRRASGRILLSLRI